MVQPLPASPGFDTTRSQNNLRYEQDRATSDKTFEETPLTEASHEDPDRHWIGGALPAASQAEIEYSGSVDDVGASLFTARADHRHDSKTIYGLYTAPFTDCSPGQTFLAGWAIAGGIDYLAPASTQVFIFPQEGLWKVHTAIQVDTAGAVPFTNQANFVYYYVNGTSNREVYRNELTGLPANNFFTATDYIDLASVDLSTINVQMAYQHSDVVVHRVTPLYFYLVREHSYFTS